jgi:hypothetical protein
MVKNEQQTKRETLCFRLQPEVIVLGRSLARSIFGSESKLGLLIEDAIQFYSAHKEDGTKASSLLKTTEDRLIQRITDRFESMNKDIMQRENKMFERIAGLQAVSSFESCLIELMLKDKISDSREKARYEELRSMAAKKMKDRFIKSGAAEQQIDLYEQNMALQNRINEFEQQLKENKSIDDKKANSTSKLEKDFKHVVNRLDEVLAELKREKGKVRDFDCILRWYERLVGAIPKAFGVKKAIRDYEENNPKPYRPEY